MQLCVLLLVGAGKSISEIFADKSIRKNNLLPPLQELLGRKKASLREASLARGCDLFNQLQQARMLTGVPSAVSVAEVGGDVDLFHQWQHARMISEGEPGEMLTGMPSAVSAAEVGGDIKAEGGDGDGDGSNDGGGGSEGSEPCDISMTEVGNDGQGSDDPDDRGGRVVIHTGVVIEVEEGAIPPCSQGILTTVARALRDAFATLPGQVSSLEDMIGVELVGELRACGLADEDCNVLLNIIHQMAEWLLSSTVEVANFAAQHVEVSLISSRCLERLLVTLPEEEQTKKRAMVTNIVNAPIPIRATGVGQHKAFVLDVLLWCLAPRSADGGPVEGGKDKPEDKMLGICNTTRNAHALHVLSNAHQQCMARHASVSSSEQLLQLMTPVELRRLALLRALAARTHCDPEGLVTPSMAALYHGYQGVANWWRDVRSVWNLEHFPPSDDQGSPAVVGIVDRICVSVSETSLIDDMAKYFGLKGPCQLYQEFDPVATALANLNQTRTFNVLNGGSPTFRAAMASGFGMSSRPLSSFVPREVEEHARATDYLKGVPTLVLAMKRTFTARDEKAWWLGAALGLAVVRVAFVVGRPMRFIEVFEPPPVRTLSTDQNGDVIGPKHRPRGGTFADGGHLMDLFPQDEYGTCARRRFWRDALEGASAAEEALVQRRSLAESAGVLEVRGSAFASISTIEHCDVAYLEAQWQMHGPIYTMISPVEMMQPYTEVLNRIADDPRRRCFLIANQVAPGTCAVPSIFASVGKQNAALPSMTREWMVGDRVLACYGASSKHRSTSYRPPTIRPPSETSGSTWIDDAKARINHMMRRYPGVVRLVYDDRSLYIEYDDGDVEDRVYPCYVVEAAGESQGKLDKEFDKNQLELLNAARAVEAANDVLKERERAWARDIQSRFPGAAKKSPEVLAAEEGLRRAYGVFERIGSRVHLFAAPPGGGGTVGIEGTGGPPGGSSLVIEGLD